MNDRTFDQLMDAWLDAGPTVAPSRVREAARLEIRSTRQSAALRWWPQQRFPSMNNTMRFGIAAAIVAVAGLLGFNYLVAPSIGGPGVGAPTTTPTPVPTPRPLRSSGIELEAGTYWLTVQGVDATISVPDGWAYIDGLQVVKNRGQPSVTSLSFWCCIDDVADVYPDPCQWEDGVEEPLVGPTVDDLATALANQALRGESLPIDVTIDGYRGKMIELSVPSDIDFADCDIAQFRSRPGMMHAGPGEIEQVYILDVGGQRLEMSANFMPGTSEADRAELQAIVDSVQLDGP